MKKKNLIFNNYLRNENKTVYVQCTLFYANRVSFAPNQCNFSFQATASPSHTDSSEAINKKRNVNDTQPYNITHTDEWNIIAVLTGIGHFFLHSSTLV
jgi:hypothetical protein